MKNTSIQVTSFVLNNPISLSTFRKKFEGSVYFVDDCYEYYVGGSTFFLDIKDGKVTGFVNSQSNSEKNIEWVENHMNSKKIEFTKSISIQ